MQANTVLNSIVGLCETVVLCGSLTSLCGLRSLGLVVSQKKE